MKIGKRALLIPWLDTITGERGYTWETPSEISLSDDFDTMDQALANRPEGYTCLDDAYRPI